MKTIGFIGAGVMGKSMVRNLRTAGYEVSVYTRTKEKALDILEEGARWCATVAECAAGKDAVITIVGFPSDVDEVYFGPSGILENARAGAYVIDMTTTDPGQSKRIYEAAKGKGIFALDAPVSGGDTGARAGTLAIMVGGEEEAFHACLPLFQAMGKNIVYEGGPGAGQHTKMANQIAVAGCLAGVCEAIAYGRGAGLDLSRMLSTIGAGAASSWQMENNGKKILVGDDKPGFYIKHYVKDMKIALSQAERMGFEPGMLRLICETFTELEKKGMGDRGTQALIHAYEK